MATAIRPLTLQERQKPAHLCFHGGFRNVSFQIGEVVKSGRNGADAGIASYVRATIHKSPKVQFPLMVPNSLPLIKGVVNTIATVVGQKNPGGTYDAVLLARATERLSSFNTKLRTVEHLIASKAQTQGQESTSEDDAGRLGKSSNARSHNQVMLAGVVVGARFEDGPYPRFHIFIRQDSNPDNIIPLCYEAKNANSMISRVKPGSIIYAEGEFVYRGVKTFEVDESGARKFNEEGKPIQMLDKEGQPVLRIQTYIRITAPKDPAEFDLDFGNSIPSWISAIAETMASARVRSVLPVAGASPPIDPRVTIYAGIPGGIEDL